MSETREMSMAGPSGMYVPPAPRGGVRQEKRRVLDRQREMPHLSRKIYHFVNGAICFAIYGFLLSEKASLWLLAIAGGFFVALDLVRLRSATLQRLALKTFGKLMRREELNGLTANSWYVFGMLGAGLFFPKAYALMGLAFLSLGDPVAAVVGTRWGRVPLLAGKSVEGSVANFVASGTAAFAIALWMLGLPAADALLVGVVGGAVSAFAEVAPWPVNDNLAIPIVSAGLLWMLLSLMGVPLPRL